MSGVRSLAVLSFPDEMLAQLNIIIWVTWTLVNRNARNILT
jgi:hypothetical protein